MQEADQERASYEIINYSLRPAKAIERRMLCELFSRLYPFQPVASYSYIGFGAIHFADFQLIHRQLGISDLTNIEHDKDNEERFRLNQPFACIQMHFDSSSLVLPALDWTKKTIAWLDYDGDLSIDSLADAAMISSKCSSGTLLIITQNVHAKKEPAQEQRDAIARREGEPFNVAKHRLELFRKQLGDKFPEDITGKQLNQQNLPNTIRRILTAEIQSALQIRNLELDEGDKIKVEQIIYFTYKDGAHMATYGWLFFKASERHLYDACHFNEIHFFRNADLAYAIKAPCLTPKEMRHLNSSLPKAVDRPITPYGIPVEDIDRYAEIYRYFPVFNESIFQ